MAMHLRDITKDLVDVLAGDQASVATTIFLMARVAKPWMVSSTRKEAAPREGASLNRAESGPTSKRHTTPTAKSTDNTPAHIHQHQSAHQLAVAITWAHLRSCSPGLTRRLRQGTCQVTPVLLPMPAISRLPGRSLRNKEVA